MAEQSAQPHSPSTPASPGAVAPPLVWGVLGRMLGKLWALPADTLALTFVVTLGAAMLLPMLGAVGFYDPWESHYAEVAREMVARDDYVHPHWKEFFFFSKPVLLFWTTAVGFKLLDLVTGGGMTQPNTNIPEIAELVARLPIALIALLTLVCVYRVTRKFFGIAAGVIASVVLITCPFFVLVGRQAITDMPFVGLATAGICLMMESFFGTDEEADTPLPAWYLVIVALVTVPQYLQLCRTTQLLAGNPDAIRYAVFAGSLAVVAAAGMWLKRTGRDVRAHLFYLLTALATLAKGLAGIMLPGLVFLLYVGLTWEWWRLRRIRAFTGAVVFVLIAVPWYFVMTLFSGKDDEGKTFLQRFWIHDHLNRLTGGVHGERGTFEYYIKQLGFGVAPWSGLLPFSWLAVGQARREGEEELRARVRLFVSMWALACFGLFSLSTTKFHHYILPMVPPLAICAGIYLAEFWEKRETPPVLVVMCMVLAMAVIGGDLFKNPHSIIDMFTYHYVSYKPDYYFPTDWPYGAALGGACGVAAALFGLGALLSWAPSVRAAITRKTTGVAELLRWVVAEIVEAFLWLGELVSGLVARGTGTAGRMFTVFACAAGIGSGYFYTQVYMPLLSPHWGQRYLFNTYFNMRQGDEPIIAYLMNWRGESFYSKGSEPQINDGNQLRARCKQPGREYVLVETSRYKGLESSLGPEFKGKVNIVDRSNAKWYLVSVDD